MMPGAPPPTPPPAEPPAPVAPVGTSAAAQVLPLSAEDLLFWRDEVERSEKLRTDTIAAWDVKGNLERYTPRSVATNFAVNVAKDFSDVERKKAALFYDTPTISLVPDSGTPPPALQLFQELLNQLLGAKRMRSKSMAMATIQDCLVAIQPCPTEIGYTAVTEVVTPPAPPPQIDPMTGQPVPMPPPQPMPVTVWEDIFWTRISPAAILLPSLMRDTRYDDAPWLGYRWRRPVSQVKREYNLPEETALADNTDEKPYFELLTVEPETGEPMCSGVKLWYRASLRDASVSHPLVIRELVLIDGMDQPVVHKGLACQTIGPDGRLTPDSMIGYPLHPLALRDLTDSPFVAADCTMTAALTNELNKFRTQVIQRREGSKLHFFIDIAKINDEVRQKITQGDTPTMIPVEPGALEGGVDKLMAQVPAITLGRESYEGADRIEHDRAGILGIDSNVVGMTGAQGAKTATEISNVQRNADARFEQERQRCLEWWLTGVQKVASLLLRYGDRIAVDILGPQRGQQWVQAKNQNLFGTFSYEIVIDSGSYVDIEQRKHQTMQLYNMTAQDPATHHEELLVQLATEFGLDPSRWIVTEKPEAKPDPPSVSIAVKPEDLDPALPSYIGTYAILTAGGMKGLPPPLTMAQPPQPGQPAQPQGPGVPPPGQPPEQPHGGMAEKSELINQHQLDQTGERSGPPPL